MKTRRHIVHTSFQFDADFLAYYDGEKLVALVVEGEALPVNGKVDVETFKKLLRAVKAKEAKCRNLWAHKRVPTYRGTSDGCPSAEKLPYANIREVFTNIYGVCERRWIR